MPGFFSYNFAFLKGVINTEALETDISSVRWFLLLKKKNKNVLVIAKTKVCVAKIILFWSSINLS